MGRKQRSVKKRRSGVASKKMRGSRRHRSQRGGATEEDIAKDPVARTLKIHVDDMSQLADRLEQLARDVENGVISSKEGEERMNELSAHFMNIYSNGEATLNNAVKSQEPATQN